MQSINNNQQYFDQTKAREKHCMLWLRSQAKRVRKSIWLAALAGMLNGLGIIAQAALLAFILHATIFEQTPLRHLVTPFLGLLLVFCGRSLCVYSQQTVGFEAGAQVRAQVRAALNQKVLTLGPTYLKQRHSGELAAIALEQVEALEPYFVRYCPQQLIVGVLPLMMLAVVFPVNWVVGVILVVTGPLVPVFMALIGLGAAAANRDQFLEMTRMNGYFLDRLQGLETLKLFGQAWQERATFKKVADSFREHTMRVLRIAFLSSAVLEFFSAVAVALVAVYVGLGLLDQVHFGPAVGIQFREALFVLLIAPEFFMPLRQLAHFYHDRAAALGAADALLHVLEQAEPTVNAYAGQAQGLIEFKHVHKRYGQRSVLTDLNIVIKAGERIALVGASGAGKTTLCNLLLGFETPSDGMVLLKGRSVTVADAAQSIAWVGQNSAIFQGSIRDNIALGDPEASEQQIRTAAQAAGVTEFTQTLAKGLDTPLGERGFGLSGGQVQRIALARAFLKPADIILLDEPTANLDDATKNSLLAVIDTLFTAKTVIIASHDPMVIQRLPRQIVLEQGRVRT